VRISVGVGPLLAAVAVPASALRKGPAGDHVFVVTQDDDGKARAKHRSVLVAATLGDEVLIRQGLSAGEEVAASGSFKLRDDALVGIGGAGAAQPSQVAGGS
jgi:membrane fusion protein (multidrug efflux system)